MSTIVMVLVAWIGVSLPASLVAGRLLRRVSSDYPLPMDLSLVPDRRELWRHGTSRRSGLCL